MNSKVNEMWTALAAYQAKADANGHGVSWKKMCSERTDEATWAAYAPAYDYHATASASACAWAALLVAADTAHGDVTDKSDDIKCLTQLSIDYITKAKGETE
jgi:hypothetical protein